MLRHIWCGLWMLVLGSVQAWGAITLTTVDAGHTGRSTTGDMELVMPCRTVTVTASGTVTAGDRDVALTGPVIWQVGTATAIQTAGLTCTVPLPEPTDPNTGWHTTTITCKKMAGETVLASASVHVTVHKAPTTTDVSANPPGDLSQFREWIETLAAEFNNELPIVGEYTFIEKIGRVEVPSSAGIETFDEVTCFGDVYLGADGTLLPCRSRALPSLGTHAVGKVGGYFGTRIGPSPMIVDEIEESLVSGGYTYYDGPLRTEGKGIMRVWGRWSPPYCTWTVGSERSIPLPPDVAR